MANKYLPILVALLLGVSIGAILSGTVKIPSAVKFEENEESRHNTNMTGVVEAIKSLGSLGPKGSKREFLTYYDSLLYLAMQYGGTARTLLEVGCATDPFAGYLSWIDKRTCVAPYQVDYHGTQEQASKRKLVQFVKADFMDFVEPRKYDLLLCSQVVEHVPDPSAFMKKLIKAATTSIISVPYEWGECHKCNHISHNITLDTIHNWTAPYTSLHHSIISDEKTSNKAKIKKRIILVYKN